jgi:hypothetical protein
VQRLGADDDRVEVEVLLVRVPAAVVDAAEQAEQVERVHPATPGDAVLAVGGEGIVLLAQRPAGADLGGLLAEQAGPDPELALALQGGGLGVDATDEDEVAVQAAQVLVGQVLDVLGVVGGRLVGDALTLGGEQLDHVRAAVADRRRRGGDVAHGRSFVSSRSTRPGSPEGLRHLDARAAGVCPHSPMSRSSQI